MAGISFSGVGSGIDFNAVRDAIINQRSIPIQQLQSRVNKYNRRTESLKDLNLLLATLTNSAKDLTNVEVGTGRAASSADASIAAVTASSAAGLGSLNLNVTRIASSLTQASRSYDSVDEPVLAGGATSATFELRAGGAAEGTEITINSSNNSLAGLRDAINAAGVGVKATIIDLTGDGTQNQLVLNSVETGASGRVELVETSTTGSATDLALRSLNPIDGDFSKLNAAFSLNGLEVVRATNTISDAITGLTLTLKQPGTTSIDVSQSNDIEEKLEAFVSAYNAVQDFIAEQNKKDTNNRSTGVLAGEAILRNIQKQVGGIVGSASSENGGPLTSLSQIGLTVDRNGRMQLDKDTLSERIEENVDDVRALFYGADPASQTGIFDSSYEVLNDLSDTITGAVQTAINGYESSARNLNETIAKRTAMLENMRDVLTRRFAAADAAIGQLNNQGSAITNFMKTLQSGGNS